VIATISMDNQIIPCGLEHITGNSNLYRSISHYNLFDLLIAFCDTYWEYSSTS